MLQAMQLDAGTKTSALASALPDVGLGSVWPTAVLAGASLASASAAGAWIGGVAVGGDPTWNFAVWSAEHALWGTGVGALVALGLRVVGRRRPLLSEPVRRRALGLRLTVGLVAAGLALPFVIFLAQDPSSRALGPLLGLLGGAGLWTLVARRRRGLSRLDPARVAALVALVTLPLANAFEIAAGPPPSLLEVWRILLTR